MPSILDAIQSFLGVQQPVISPVPEEVISPVPEGQVSGFDRHSEEKKKLRDSVVNFYKSKMPKSETTPVEKYYPVMNDIDSILEKEDIRKGAGALGALQAFYESTGGRATSNLFGVKPGDKSKKFPSNKEAIDYQYSPRVLGGGSANRLNILNKKTPLTTEEIEQMYQAYNPEGDYLPSLLRDFQLVMGK